MQSVSAPLVPWQKPVSSEERAGCRAEQRAGKYLKASQSRSVRISALHTHGLSVEPSLALTHWLGRYQSD